MNWARRLNLLPEWDQANREEITPAALGKVISARPEGLTPFGNRDIDEMKAELVKRFKHSRSQRGINSAMEGLYDWGDQRFGFGKVCWVQTF